MDTESAAAEAVTLFASAGAAARFLTGRRSHIVVGHPILPVIKTANPCTVNERSEHIDGCGESGLDEAANRLEAFLAGGLGRLTAGEILGDKEREFAPTRLVPSA